MWRWGIIVGVHALLQVTIGANLSRVQCPIGFDVARRNGDDSLCYKLKNPESFEDHNAECTGNLYSQWLLGRFDFRMPNSTVQLWSDYRNTYPGGPLVAWPPPGTDAPRGKLLFNSSAVRNALEEDAISVDELCAVADSATGELTAVDCSDRHRRLCVVKKYDDDLDRVGCGSGYVRMYSPRPACMQRLDRVRATWGQARDMCAQRNGTLLQRGWRLANHPALRPDTLTAIPLGIVMTPNDGLDWAEFAAGNLPEDWLVAQAPHGSIDPEEWNFSSDEQFPAGATMVALYNDKWKMVNESYIFYSVVCEQPIELPRLQMNLTSDQADPDRMWLTLDAHVKKDDISCFTDGDDFPSIRSVDLSNTARNSTFTELKLEARWDGYYWCVSENTRRFQPARTERVLHVREQAQLYTYALKLQVDGNYSLSELDDVSNQLRESVAEYIYAYSKFIQTNGNDTEVNATVVRALAARDYSVETDDVVYTWRVRRAYLDARSLLVHARLSAVTLPLPPSRWRDLRVIYMKPVYFCKPFDSVPMLPLGGEATSSSCVTNRCVGDFNSGVQWLESDNSTCQRRVQKSAPTTTTVSAGVRVGYLNYTETVNATTSRSTTTEAPPATESDDTREEASTVTLETTTEAAPAADRPPEIRPPPTTPAPPAQPDTTGPPTQRPPEQVVLDVLENLETMLHDEHAVITVTQLNDAADQMDVLLEMAADAEIPGKLLHLIDEVGARMQLNGSQSQTAVRDNIGFLVADSSPAAPVRGLRLAYSGTDALSDDSFHLLTGDVSESYIEQNASEVVVKLPETLVDSERRVTFVVFRNSNAFSAANAQPAVNSRVLSVNITNLTSFADGDYVDIHLRPLDSDVPRDARRACAYWHFNEDDTGYWSQAGCTFIRSSDPSALDVCRCTHLTHFAEILAPRTVFSQSDESALEAISVTGCALSIAGLLVIALTAALFRAWRRDFVNKVWLQLSAAILALMMTFLVVVYSRFDSSTPACVAAGVVLHYAMLSSFAWMSVAAVLSYRRLVLVFARDASHKLLRACAFAWGAPAAAVGILLAVDPTAYSSRFTDVENTTASFCYPTGVALWVTVYSPIAAALLVNWVLFALIVHSVFASRRVKRHGDTGEALRCATVSSLLVFLFGLPWIFGLFSTLLVFAYLFALTATYQGFVLFLFFVVGNKKTRDMWLNKLKIKQSQKVPVTSSTYKSSGWRGGGAGGGSSSSGAAAMEEASAKPRSLTGRDDEARFS